MARKLMQDMVKVGGPKIRKISKVEKQLYKSPKPTKRPPINREQKKKSPKYRIFILAFISVVFLLFALSLLFSKAKITVEPRTESIEISDDITATKDSSGALSFDLVVLSGEETKTVEGGGLQDVSVSAKGKVVIYNSYSSANQTLDVDTRLEGSNGKIYKTVKRIVVPGVKSDGKPGSIEVDVYAASPGESYNSGPLDFKIVGFKGTSKYEKFYARSVGDLTGGFVGKSPVVSDLEKEGAKSELKATLETKLLNKIKDQIPSGFVLFKDAVVLNIKDGDILYTAQEDGSVLVAVRGTLYGFLLSTDKLAEKLAQDSVEDYDGGSVYLNNIRDLTFTLKDENADNLASIKNIKFNISGKPSFVWKVDEGKLTSDVLGKEKKDFNTILEKYPNIVSTNLVFRPFWKKSFPEDLNDIEVIVNYPPKE